MGKISVVGVYIERDGKILLVQEKGYAYGLWSVPLGHVEINEGFEEAAKREVKEETGYEIKITNKLFSKTFSDKEYRGGKRDIGKQIEVTCFSGEVIGGDLKPNLEDVLDAKWFGKSETQKLPLRSTWLSEILVS